MRCKCSFVALRWGLGPCRLGNSFEPWHSSLLGLWLLKAWWIRTWIPRGWWDWASCLEIPQKVGKWRKGWDALVLRLPVGNRGGLRTSKPPPRLHLALDSHQISHHQQEEEHGCCAQGKDEDLQADCWDSWFFLGGWTQNLWSLSPLGLVPFFFWSNLRSTYHLVSPSLIFHADEYCFVDELLVWAEGLPKNGV